MRLNANYHCIKFEHIHKCELPHQIKSQSINIMAYLLVIYMGVASTNHGLTQSLLCLEIISQPPGAI
jgi:hypothetical protein